MPVIWDEKTELAYIALTYERSARHAKATEAAKEAAWRDLPRNERNRYYDFAYRAIKQEEKAS